MRCSFLSLSEVVKVKAYKNLSVPLVLNLRFYERFSLCQVLKLLLSSLEELFAVLEEEQTLKEAMTRNMWTVLRPTTSDGEV